MVDAKSLTFLRLLALGLVLRPTDEYAAPFPFKGEIEEVTVELSNE